MIVDMRLRCCRRVSYSFIVFCVIKAISPRVFALRVRYAPIKSRRKTCPVHVAGSGGNFVIHSECGLLPSEQEHVGAPAKLIGHLERKLWNLLTSCVLSLLYGRAHTTMAAGLHAVVSKHRGCKNGTRLHMIEQHTYLPVYPTGVYVIYVDCDINEHV